MHEYKIRFSYFLEQSGKQIYEYEYATCTTVREAVESMKDAYSDLSRLKIEQIWIDRNNRWEIIEWED